MALNRQQLTFEAPKLLATDTVVAPEWGGDVRLRRLSLGERDALLETITKGALAEGAAPLQAWVDGMKRLVLLSIVDDDGQRVFADDEMAALDKLDPVGFEKVRDAAQALNNIRLKAPDKEAAEDGPLPDSAPTGASASSTA